MILPVVAFGHPVLKKPGIEIDPSYPGLADLINNMFETMYQSEGVGLAAQQVNHAIRLFVVDASPYNDKFPEAVDFKKVFINAKIYQYEGEDILFNEGCLSFPGIREDIVRKPVIYMKYLDENFQPHDEKFEGIVARVMQHEYDHTDGVTFIERTSPLKRILLKGKLTDISKGNVDVSYKMLFPLLKKKRV
ncbi:MAG: peptide deformylase [Bacteroidetes bacterium]|nr:peptide deformylase [Bacteroidota bacterium]